MAKTFVGFRQVRHRKQTKSPKLSRIQQFDAIADHLNIKVLDDFYNVTWLNLVDAGAGALLRQFRNSTFRALSILYPEHEWKPWKFTHAPHNHWESIEHQVSFINDYAKRYNIKTCDGFYTVSWTDINENGGASVIHKYNFSMLSMLRALCPHYDWQAWKFASSRMSHWGERSRQHSKLNAVAASLGVKTLEDWFLVTKEDVIALGGRVVLQVHSGSLEATLTALFPKFEWKLGRFARKRLPYATVVKRSVFDRVANSLGITTLSDWYNVPTDAVYSSELRGIMNTYKSLSKALIAVYPEHNWHRWHFWRQHREALPIGYWHERKNQFEFLRNIEATYSVTKATWPSVSIQQICKLGGHGILSYYPHILSQYYPEVPWRWQEFSSVTKRSNQRHLTSRAKGLFAGA